MVFKIDFKKICLLLLTCSLLIYCAGTQPPGAGTSKVVNLGKASEYDIYNTIPRLLRKYHYEILHGYDTGAYQSIETEWKTRYPLEDERQVGIMDGKIKLHFRIRKTVDQLYYVRLEIENMIKTPDAQDYFISPMSKMLKTETYRMVDELKQEFDEGRLTR